MCRPSVRKGCAFNMVAQRMPRMRLTFQHARTLTVSLLVVLPSNLSSLTLSQRSQQPSVESPGWPWMPHDHGHACDRCVHPEGATAAHLTDTCTRVIINTSRQRLLSTEKK